MKETEHHTFEYIKKGSRLKNGFVLIVFFNPQLKPHNEIKIIHRLYIIVILGNFSAK